MWKNAIPLILFFVTLSGNYKLLGEDSISRGLKKGQVVFLGFEGDTYDRAPEGRVRDEVIAGVKYVPGIGKGSNWAAEFNEGRTHALRSSDLFASDMEGFTLSMWFQYSGFQNATFGGLVSYRIPVDFSPDKIFYNVNVYYGEILVEFNQGVLVRIPKLPEALKWHHILLVCDQGAFRVVFDGQTFKTGQRCTMSNPGRGARFEFDRMNAFSNFKVDNFRIWNRGLTRSEQFYIYKNRY